MKLFANLMNLPSNDATMGLPNSGRVEDPVAYDLLSYPIGSFDAENDLAGSRFLEGKDNSEFFDYTTLLESGGAAGDPVSMEYSYTHPVRQYISYNGPKPDFPLEYADPEPGCCIRKDAPFELPETEETEPEEPGSASPLVTLSLSAALVAIIALVV